MYKYKIANLFGIFYLFLLSNSFWCWAGRPLKPLLSGLVYMGNCNFLGSPGRTPDNSLKVIEAHPGVFSGVVINVTWGQLEPSPGQFITTAIDLALDSIREYNLKNPKNPLLARLRVWSGVNAPSWIKNAGGRGPVKIFRKGGLNHWQDVSRFWTGEYRHFWWELQHKLGGRYDTEPLISEVANSSCSSLTDEPFIFPGDRESQSNLRSVGYTDQAILNCLSDTATDYSAWATTRIEYPFNPFRRTDSGRTVLDYSITYAIMKSWREALGDRAVISNHAIGKTKNLGSVKDELEMLLNQIRKMGPPIEFQTASPEVVSDWNRAMTEGISRGGTAIEIWAPIHAGSMFDQVKTEQFLAWSKAIKRNLMYFH